MSEKTPLKDPQNISNLYRIFERLESGFLSISGITIFFMMCLTTADVFGRYFLARPIIGTVEISELLMIMIIYLALAYTEKTNTHISMDLIPDMLKRKKRWIGYHAAGIFNIFPPLVVFAFGSYLFFSTTYKSYLTREASFGPLYIRYWPLKIIIGIGFGFLALRLGIKFVDHMKSLVGRNGKMQELK